MLKAELAPFPFWGGVINNIISFLDVYFILFFWMSFGSIQSRWISRIESTVQTLSQSESNTTKPNIIQIYYYPS